MFECILVKVNCSVMSLFNSLDCRHQALLSIGFTRQEYWSGLPFPLPGNLPNPGLKPGSPVSPALQDFLPTEPGGSPIFWLKLHIKNKKKDICINQRNLTKTILRFPK